MTVGAAEAPLRLEDAVAGILRGALPLASETVPLAEAVGRVLAAPVVAALTLPPFDNSAMDGFAVRGADVAAASAGSPAELAVIGEAAAGHEASRRVEPGSAIRIMTGAMLPEGADAVVPVEETDAPAGVSALPDRVRILAPAPAGRHIRRAGSDVRSGDTVLPAGRVVGPAAVALLAGTGHTEAAVHRRPRVAVLATGDELVPAGAPVTPAHIPDSNTPALLAQARAAGGEAVSFGIAPDDPFALGERLREAAAWADVVVLTGGVSVGAHDHVRAAFSTLGEIEFWRVAIQPGKPLAFGRTSARRAGDRSDPDRSVALFGLPGNPVSAFVTFELFVRPLLRALEGRDPAGGRRRARARLAEPASKSPGRRAFLRVRLEPDPERPGAFLARQAGGQGSHMLSSLAAADALAVIPEDVPALPAGAEVEVWELEDEGA